MKKHFWSIYLLIILITSCDKDIGGSNSVDGSLNLELVNGDYIAKDADAVFNAYQRYSYYYIIFPPDTIPQLLVDTTSYIYAKIQENNSGIIYYGGVLLHNNDSIAFNIFGGYRESSFTRLAKAIFEKGSNWNLEGNSSGNVQGFTYNNSQNIPNFELSTIPQLFNKSQGIRLDILSNNINSNRLIAVIKNGDSVKYQAEFPVNTDSLIIAPKDIQHLESDRTYELRICAKNYTLSISNNKKTYYLNEIERNYYIAFKP